MVSPAPASASSSASADSDSLPNPAGLPAGFLLFSPTTLPVYSPAAFTVTDPALIREIIRDFPFAILVGGDSESLVTHLPVLAAPESSGEFRLFAHLAKANSHWRHLAAHPEVLVIFHGPHAYVSPQWYANQPAVPTWNYIAIHAYARARVFDTPEALAPMVTALTDVFEAPGAPRPPAEFLDRMLAGIVGLELSVHRFEAKFKLSQNRSAEDVAGVIAALEQSSDTQERATALWMRRMAEATIASTPTAAKTSTTL